MMFLLSCKKGLPFFCTEGCGVAGHFFLDFFDLLTPLIMKRIKIVDNKRVIKRQKGVKTYKHF